MSGLVSPRPVSYNNYNPYARNVPPQFTDSPANVGAAMTIHTPSQGVAAYPGTSPALPAVAHEEQKVYGLVIDLLNPEKREGALLELSKKREQYDDLALVLWHSFGKRISYRNLGSCLMIVHQVLCRHCFKRSCLSTPCSRRPILPHMRPIACVTLSRCYNVLLLIRRPGSFSSMVSSTSAPRCGRCSRVAAHIPLFLYPFLNTTSKTRPFEYLRLTSLGVIGALVKVRFYHVYSVTAFDPRL